MLLTGRRAGHGQFRPRVHGGGPQGLVRRRPDALGDDAGPVRWIQLQPADRRAGRRRRERQGPFVRGQCLGPSIDHKNITIGPAGRRISKLQQKCSPPFLLPPFSEVPFHRSTPPAGASSCPCPFPVYVFRSCFLIHPELELAGATGYVYKRGHAFFSSFSLSIFSVRSQKKVVIVLSLCCWEACLCVLSSLGFGDGV